MLNGSNKLNSLKIYFPIYMGNGWLGGLNYYKNLFQAIEMTNQNVKIYIPDKNPDELYKFAIKRHDKKDAKYRYKKLLAKIKGQKFNKKEYFVNNYNIISHTSNFNYNIPTISWIPDFQHIYLKDFFTKDEIIQRDRSFREAAEKSSIIILSSNDAKNDFAKLYPEHIQKAHVLNFVSYINPNIYEQTNEMVKDIYQKYNLPSKYFYIPNQFWQHKNHITVFKAISELKKRGIDVNVVCSGYMEDYRNKNYLNDVLIKYINENDLQNNIKFLGVIDLNEVYLLMRNSIAVINPSLFEGWSSTVEEVKSLGKNIILSDLNVHKEQNPPQATYFERQNYVELSNILEYNWNNLEAKPNYELEEDAKRQMNLRMINFGNEYLKIIEKALEK